MPKISESDLMLSVWITTYNHEKFIAECLEGVLMQQTNFNYEIIIGDDCSTDRTREIVLAYKQGISKPFLNIFI